MGVAESTFHGPFPLKSCYPYTHIISSRTMHKSSFLFLYRSCTGVDVIKLFFEGNLDSLDLDFHLSGSSNLKPFQMQLTVLKVRFYIFVQVQTSEQTCFNFLILGKSRFHPKSFITSTTAARNV